MREMSLADKATMVNMCPEYGATMAFFLVDNVTLDYLRLTGRSEETVRHSSFYPFFYLFFLSLGCNMLFSL